MSNNSVLAIDKNHLRFAETTKNALVLKDPRDLDFLRTDVLIALYNNSVENAEKVDANTVSHSDIMQKILKLIIENPVHVAKNINDMNREKRVYRSREESVAMIIELIRSGKTFKLSDISNLLGCKETTASAMLALVRNRNGDYKIPVKKISAAGEPDTYVWAEIYNNSFANKNRKVTLN